MRNDDITGDIPHRLDDLGNRLERIELKLDDHLQRVTRAEKDIEWLRGHVRMTTMIFLGVIGTVGAILANYLFPFGK